MEQNRFFRAVWRFNALLLALGGIFILAAIGWNLLFSPLFTTLPAGGFTPVPKSAEKDHTYRLSRLQVNVGEENIFELGRWKGAPNVYGLQSVALHDEARYIGPDTVNLLAVDGAHGTSHWLFHGYAREILSQDTIVESRPPRDPGVAAAASATATALVIHTIDADTDKDGALTEKDNQTLYIYRPGMGFATKLLDADYILSSDQSGDAGYLVVYERGKDAVAAFYSLPDFKLVSEKPIPSVP